jgi:predicted MFS family arabinose efflux permease
VITATFISVIVRTSPELRSIEPVIWLVVGLAAIPSVALWTWIGGRFGNAWSFAIACLVEGVGVAMSVLATSALAIAVSAALLGGTFMGITALGLVHARHISSGDPRRSLALMTAAFGLGQMIGPTFAGLAYDLDNSFLVPSLAAAAALFVAAGLVVDPRTWLSPSTSR